VTATDGPAPPVQPVSVLTSRWRDGLAHGIDRYLELDGYASLSRSSRTPGFAAAAAPASPRG
jgi:hypothetical protein